MSKDLSYTEVENMEVEALCEYHDHKSRMNDMKAESEMMQWRAMPESSRGAAPYRRAN